MAVDTRRKRFSMMRLGDVWSPGLTTPDGTIDQGDRQTLLFGYAGILWGAPPDLPLRICLAVTTSSFGATVVTKNSALAVSTGSFGLNIASSTAGTCLEEETCD